MQKRKKVLAVMLAVMLMAGMVTIPAVADSLEGTASEESSSTEESSAVTDESSSPAVTGEEESIYSEGGELNDAPNSSREPSAVSEDESGRRDIPAESGEESAAPASESATAGSTGVTVTSGGENTPYEDLPSAVASLKDGDTLSLAGGTYSAKANEQLRITADNVTIRGAGSGATVIDCGAYSVSGQAGILVAADNVTIADLKVISSAGSNVSAVKYSYVENGIISGGTIDNVIISSQGHGLNLHGTNAISVNGVVIENTGKANIALAMSSGVNISNTSTSTGGWNTDVGLMYAESDAYAAPCQVTIGEGNSFANSLIYSERPSSAAGGGDEISGCANAGLSIMKSDDGTWAAVASGSVAGLPYIEESGIRFKTIQKAVDAAEAGDTVKIPAGTFKENIAADKQVTLVGEGEGSTVIQFIPEGRQSYLFLGSRAVYPVIYSSADLTVKNLTVSGPTGQHHGIDGIYATAGLHLENVGIRDIRCTADGGELCGTQYGRPVLVEGSGNVSINGCAIVRFQKQAMDLNTSGTVEINNTVITGYGPQQIIAQNGIVIRKGTVSINGCALSGMSYTVDNEYKNASAAIYAFGGANVQVNGTRISDVDIAIELDDQGTSVSGTNNTILSPVHNLTTGDGSVKLTKCYWGENPDFSGVITGSVSYMPYYTDAEMTNLADEISGIKLSNVSLDTVKGDRIFLNAVISPDNAYDKTVVWASSDGKVATVQDGVVTVVAEEGVATITAEAANGMKGTCEITVKKPVGDVPPVTIPGTDGEKILEVRPGVDENNIVDSGLILSAVNSAAEDEVIVVAVPKESAGNAVIEGSAIKEAARRAQEAGGSKTIAITTPGDDETVKSIVTIDLSGIKDLDSITDINVGATNSVDKELGDKAAGNLPEGAEVMFINLTHNGAFPFPITRSDYVGGKYKEGTEVYLYWVNADGMLSEEQKLTVDENGYITYTILHASPYIVSDSAAKQEKIKVDVPKILSSEYTYTGSEIQAQFEDYDTSVIDCDNTKGTEVGSYVTMFWLKDKDRYEWNTDTNKDGVWQYTWKITAASTQSPSPTPSGTPGPTAAPEPTASPEPTAAPTVTPEATPTASPSAGPKTGDDSSNAFPIMLAVIAAAGILSFAAVKVRKSR